MPGPSHLTIELLSDTTFASTTSSGSLVDIDVEHDPITGLPVLRGKTLHGLLRDSWLSMRAHFAPLDDAFVRVLGKDRAYKYKDESIVHIGNALPPVFNAVSEVVGDASRRLRSEQIRASLTTTRRQTAIERESGAADDGSLRSSRTIIKGLSFHAPLTWFKLPTDADLYALWLCASATRHLGLRRNRGRGFVRVTLSGYTPPAEPPIVPSTDHGAVSTTSLTVPTALDIVHIVRYLPYKLALQAPLLATSLGGEPNSVRTLDYVPGSLIRGALASKLLEADVKAESDIFQRYVLDDSICCLNAYPQISGDQRALPTPTTLQQWKYKDDLRELEGYDLAAWTGSPEPGDSHILDWPEKQLEGGGTTYVVPGEENGVNVKKSMQLHHRRHRTKGRATQESGSGEVFAYESIEARQIFRGLFKIHAADEGMAEAIADSLKRLFAVPITLGRSRHAEYGGLTTLDFDEAMIEHELDQDAPTPPALSLGDELLVTLTSDYLGRHPHTGQSDPSAFELELEPLGIEVVRRYQSFVFVGGFNRKWRTALPQALALRAGSTFVFRATRNITVEDLHAIEHGGLGERRSEGFGRLVFSSLPERERDPFDRTDSPDLAPLGNDVEMDERVLTLLQKRLFQRGLIERLDTRVADYVKGTGPLPSASLLGSLLTRLRQGPDDLRERLSGPDSKRLKKKSMDKIKACKVQGEPLNDLLLTLCGRGDDWYEKAKRILNLSELANDWCLLSDTAEADRILRGLLGEHLRRDLLACLLSALIRKAKEERS